MAKITTYHKGDMLFESRLGNHSLVIDVPPLMGGSNRGPTPPELFVASLGSCVGAFVGNYCRAVGIDTTDLTVDVTFDRVGKPTRLANLKVTVNLPHGECHERAMAIQRVAKHCPVHETLATLSEIKFELVDKHARAPAEASSSD